MERWRSPVTLKKRWLLVVLSFGGAAFFFYLGYLIADRSALPTPESSRLAVSQPVVESHQGRGRESLEKVLSRLERQLAVCQPSIVVSRDWELMRNGSHEWTRVRLQGECQDITALRQVLEPCEAFLAREFNLRFLAHLDKNGGTLDLLILDGDKVVVVGSFVLKSEKLALQPDPSRPYLAIVIDDLGRSLESAAAFAALPLPLTFAVFPLLGNSLAVASYLVDHQRDIMLHAPMEPRGYPAVDPGPGALFSSMGEDELNAVFVKDLQFLPAIVGVNNHMGSHLTADSQKMTQVMKILKGRNLFFLDSRTSAESVAYKSAVAAGIPALQRDVFLDNVQDVDHIIEQLRALIEVAKVKGSSIGIGHPYPETVTALALLPEMASRAGVEIVPLRELAR